MSYRGRSVGALCVALACVASFLGGAATGAGAVEPAATTLTNGAPTTIAGVSGSMQYWKIDVPAGQSSFAVSLSGGSNVSLYVRRGSAPTFVTYDCGRENFGNPLPCNFVSPAAGTWWIMVYGVTAYSGTKLTATYPAPNIFDMGVGPSPVQTVAGRSVSTRIFTALRSGAPHNVALSVSGLPAGATASFSPANVTASPDDVIPGGMSTLTLTAGASTAPGTYSVTVTGTGAVVRTDIVGFKVVAPTPLTNGVPLTVAAPDSLQYWKIDVPAGQPSLAVSIAGGAGNADLYVRRDNVPTLTSFDCRSNQIGNNERCTFSRPAAGTWYVMLDGRGSFSRVILTAAYPAPNDFSINAITDWVPAAPGSAASTTILTATTYGSPSNVMLTASGLPAGATASFSPATVTSDGTSTLTMSAGPTTAPGMYTIVVTGTGAVIRTTTFSLQVIAPTPLQNGVPATLAGRELSFQYLKFDVPAGVTSLKIARVGGSGDMDLYVRRGALPTFNDHDCLSYLTGNETCAFVAPVAGTWYVKLLGRSAYSGVTLTAQTNPIVNELVNGTNVRKLSGAQESEQLWKLVVPPGRLRVSFITSKGSGNADIYVGYGSLPTLTRFACAATTTDNRDRCTITAPAAGVYYVMVHGQRSYQGVTLRGVY